MRTRQTKDGMITPERTAVLADTDSSTRNRSASEVVRAALHPYGGAGRRRRKGPLPKLGDATFRAR
jgi:hypothetical protein